MIGFLIRRTLLGIMTLWVISVVAFLVIQLPPGDFASHYFEYLLGGMLAEGTGVQMGDPAIEQQLREDFGLDGPVTIQYSKWAWRVLHLDFGISLEIQRKITEVIGQRLVNTALLAFGTILFTWVLSIPIGIYSALHHNTVGD